MSVFRSIFYPLYIRRAKFAFTKALAGITGNGSITESADSISGVSSVRVNATGTIIELRDTLSGLSTISVNAVGAIIELRDTINGTSSVNVFATGSMNEGQDIMTSSKIGSGGLSAAFKMTMYNF